MSTDPIIKPRGFMAATRLEMQTSELPPSDQRKLLVDEIQELVAKVNGILERRDGIYRSVPRRPKGLREQKWEELAEEYAELMVKIEEKHAQLKEVEKAMKLPDLEV